MGTFLQLKIGVRARLWPAGEARNLRVAHDKSIVDALVDIQRWAECWQTGNTHIIPHCNTTYKCGITSFDFPRAQIKGLSVIDKINPDTHKEDATSDDDYCSEIFYKQVDACHIKQYQSRSQECGHLLPFALYFALPSSLCIGKTCRAPVPTDEGLPTNLPLLPLGHHYAQGSTDGKARARAGVWAIERGRIMVAPWIQSTETIIVKWDGLKREWNDADQIEDDPDLLAAVDAYVSHEHETRFGKDPGAAAAALIAYQTALQKLLYDCEQETKTRDCEQSKARGISPTTALFFNDQQQATASCQGNQTGSSVTVTIPKDTVASSISVADANQKAKEQAQTQAEAQLDCEPNQTLYYNTAQSYTAQCLGDPPVGTPLPDGNPVTVTVPPGTFSSTVSQADANSLALQSAQIQALAALNCTYWNAEQTAVVACPVGTTGPSITKTVAAHTYFSTLSQDDANNKALNAANVAATQELVCDAQPAGYFNTQQIVQINRQCARQHPNGGSYVVCTFVVTVTVQAGRYASVSSQIDANFKAASAGNSYAQQLAAQLCAQPANTQCGNIAATL